MNKTYEDSKQTLDVLRSMQDPQDPEEAEEVVENPQILTSDIDTVDDVYQENLRSTLDDAHSQAEQAGTDVYAQKLTEQSQQLAMRGGEPEQSPSDTSTDATPAVDASSPSAPAVEPSAGVSEANRLEDPSAYDYAADVAGQGFVGAALAVENTVEALLVDLPEFLGLKEEQVDAAGVPIDHFDFAPDLPARTVAGDIARPLGQFGSAFVPFLGLARWATISIKGIPALLQYPKLANALHTGVSTAIAGPSADFFAFDPNEERISDVLIKYPALKNPVTEYLASDPNDSAVEARFKTSLEGVLVGLPFTTVFGAFKLVKRIRHASRKGAEAGMEEMLRDEFQTAASNLSAARYMYQDVENLVSEIRKFDTGNPALVEAVNFLRKYKDRIPPPEHLEELSPEARAYVDSAETIAGASGEKNIRTALEQQYNAQTSDAVGMNAALKTLRESESPQAARIANALEKLRADGGAMTDIQSHVAEALEGAEKAWGDLVLSEKGGKVNAAFREELEAIMDGAYPKGYANEVSSKFNHPKVSHSKRVLYETRDPIDEVLGRYDDEGNIFRNPSALSNQDRASFLHALRSGDYEEMRKVSEEIYLRTGVKPAYRLRAESIDGPEAFAEVYQDVLEAVRQNPGRYNDEFTRTRHHWQTAAAGRTLAESAQVTEKMFQAFINGASQDLNMGKAALETILRGADGDSLGNIRDLDIKLAAIQSVTDGMMHEINIRAGLMNSAGMSQTQVVETLNMIDELGRFLDAGMDIRSTAGRTLSFTQSKGMQADFQKLRVEREIMEKHGGTEAVRNFMLKFKMIMENGNSYQAKAFLRKSKREKWRDGLIEYWMGSILSDPVTQTVNIASNTVMGTYLPAEQSFGRLVSGDTKGALLELRHYQGIIRGFQHALKASNTARRALAIPLKSGNGAELARVAGQLPEEELGTFWKSLISGKPQTGTGMKLEVAGGAFTPENLTPISAQKGTRGGMLAHMVKFMALVPQATFRSLTSMDDLAKSINQHMRITRDSYEMVDRLGLEGSERTEFLREARSWAWRSDQLPEDHQYKNIFNKLNSDSMRYAERATFTEPQENAEAIRMLSRFTTKHPVTKFAIPFLNTPYNIGKAIAERTPGVAKHTAEYKAALADEVADPGRLQAAKMRQRVGAMLWVTSAGLASSGRLTGSYPANAAERDRMKLRGIPEHAIWFDVPYEDMPEQFKTWYTPGKDGGVWFKYGRLDPFAAFLGLSADVFRGVGNLEDAEMTELAGVMTQAVTQNLTSKTYMEGLTRLIDIASADDSIDASRELNRFLASWVPNALTRVRKVYADPHMREANTLWEHIQNKTPWSSTLLPVTNIFNEPQPYEVGIGHAMVSPFVSEVFNPDPVADAIGQAEFNVTVKQFYGNVDGVELEPDEIAEYKRLMNVPRGGYTYKQALGLLVAREDFKIKSNGLKGGKWTAINRITTMYKEKAKESLLNSDKFDIKERSVMAKISDKVNSAGTVEMQARHKLMEEQVREGVPVSKAVSTLINKK